MAQKIVEKEVKYTEAEHNLLFNLYNDFHNFQEGLVMKMYQELAKLNLEITSLKERIEKLERSVSMHTTKFR